MEQLVEIAGLGKSYPMTGREVQVLRDLDMEVQHGEFVAIMGASGSGKSTLLHILGGLDRHTRGTYRFAGRDMQALSDARLSAIRAGEVGFIFQSFNLIPQLSVYENVELPFFYGAEIPLAADERITDALSRVGLSHRLRHRPSELSGGEMQRVAIARAIVMSPRLILADEPTGSLDSATGEQILAIMEELNTAGATVLLVTHNFEVAKRARRHLVLKDGRFVS
jgi:putative ABC transport system ATP-binding protein